MPTAFTVIVPTTVIEPPLDMYFAVPARGTGLVPSVVYQMPVFLSLFWPGFVKVTVCDPLELPLGGEMTGATLVCAQVFDLLKVFAVAVAV
jgi:hypothetical protein